MNRFYILVALSILYSVHAQDSHSGEDIFTDIYIPNKWQDAESTSGRSSNLYATRLIREEIPKLLHTYNIQSLLDIPCDDFNLMRLVELDKCHYIGIDIVKPLIQENNARFKDSQREFRCLNTVEDPLPQADLIFCRDMLVHLGFPEIFKAPKNFRKSGSAYLLVTTFVEKIHNKDITTRKWHKLNLQKPPFNFPAPLTLIDEKSSESSGRYKCLGLWLSDAISLHNKGE